MGLCKLHYFWYTLFMKHIVYKITNKLNQFFYIGVHSTNNIHDNYYGSGYYVLRALNKYGKENFNKEILVICENREEACYIEEQLISIYINFPNCYNLKRGNQYSHYLGINKKNLKGSNNPMFGKQHSNESKEKISKSKIGYKLGKQTVNHLEKRRQTKLLTYLVVSPDGSEYITKDLPSFCKQYNLKYKRMSKLSRFANHTCRSGVCEGWSCMRI